MLRLILGLFFIALPFLEIALLIRTGQVIGFWATVAMVVGAAVLGALIWSRQGLSVARKAREAVAQGRPPVGPVLDGAFLLLAGALLITPGFLTDIMGLLLLVPPIRHKVMRWTARRLVEHVHVQARTFGVRVRREAGQPPPGAGRGPVIEGEFERLGEEANAPNRSGQGEPT
jgi:UPF0716 protein FxsA